MEKEIFNVYQFILERNKCVLKGNSPQELKDKLIKKNCLKCYICNKEFNSKHSFELEHKIPVSIGGKIFCLSNLGLVCFKCHSEKTSIDKKVINIIKNSGIMVKGLNNSFMSLEEIRNIYSYWFKIIKDCEDKYQRWYYGRPEVDYKQIMDISNREVNND